MGNFDPKIMARKAAISVGKSLGAVLIAAAVAYFQDPALVQKALSDADLSPGLIALLIPLLHGGATMISNWLKHKDKVEE